MLNYIWSRWKSWQCTKLSHTVIFPETITNSRCHYKLKTFKTISLSPIGTLKYSTTAFLRSKSLHNTAKVLCIHIIVYSRIMPKSYQILILNFPANWISTNNHSHYSNASHVHHSVLSTRQKHFLTVYHNARYSIFTTHTRNMHLLLLSFWLRPQPVYVQDSHPWLSQITHNMDQHTRRGSTTDNDDTMWCVRWG